MNRLKQNINNQLSCSIVVCEVLKYHHLAFILTLLTSGSAVTNNRRRRGSYRNEKSHIKMLKVVSVVQCMKTAAVLIGEVRSQGRGICPLPSSTPRGIWQLKCPHPREFAIREKKIANARGLARGGHGRSWN